MRHASDFPGPTRSPVRGSRLAACLVSLLAGLALLGAFASAAAANTAVTSNITTDTTWTKAGSPYEIDISGLRVAEGAILTVEPGVTVDFTGEYSQNLTVYGTIKAIGTAGEPITFTSQEGLEGRGEPSQYMGVWVRSGNSASRFSHTVFYYGSWGGTYNSGDINAAHGSVVSIDHSRFEHNGESAVWATEGGTADVSYSTIVNNHYGVAVQSNAVLNVSHTTISDNAVDGINVEIPTKSSSFTYNTITGNERRGMYVLDECTEPPSTFPHGEYNNIYGNGGTEPIEQHQIWAGSLHCGSLSVDWRNNYWGSDVYFYRNDPACAGTATPYLGHLAYTWSHPKYAWQVPKGPIRSYSTYYSSPYSFECGWDVFAIGPNDFLTSPVEGAPMPTPTTFFGGEPGLFAPWLPTVNCGHPINCITGNFYETSTDLRVPGLNGGLSFARSYNALAAKEGAESALGHGWSYEYGEKLELDPSGTAATITNGDGARVTFTEEAGAWTAPAWVQATLVKNGDGTFTYTLPSQRAFKFSSEGRLLSIADRNGNETTLSYSEGRLTSVTDPSGRQLTFSYNAAGRIESVTDPAGRKASFIYDEAGNLTAVTDPGEARESYGYDASHEMTSMRNPRGGETTNTYDYSGRVTSQVDPMKRETKWAYGAEATEVTLPTGAVTRIAFKDNLPTEITYAYGTSQAATTKYEYDEDLYPVSRTDPDGHKIEFGYDAEGNRTSEKDALGHETTRTYNSKHEVVSVTTPRGEKTTIERDAHGNAISISRPAPGEATQTTSFKYRSNGELESKTNPLGHTWTYGYDSHGDLTSQLDPEGDETTLAYDEDSRLASIVSPRGNLEGANPAEYTTAIERDARGRPVKVTDPLGHATEYGWDADGNLTSRTDAEGHTTKYVYDADNERTKVEKPNGAVLETGYDALGRVASLTDANKHTTKYVRNLLGRPVEIVDPLERKTSAEYDAAGNLTSVLDAAGRTTTYAYDAANRLTKTSYSDGTTPSAEFSYDADGNLTSIKDGTGESSYAYDSLDRLTEAKDGHGSLVSYEYDLGNEQTGIAYPNGKAVSRSFDKAGRLASLTDWLGHTTAFSYSPESELAKTTFPEGTGNADEYAYDRAGAMSEAKMLRGAETLASLAYARDKLGQLESLTASGLPGAGSESFSYDANDRLTKAGEASFGYDAADNLTKAPGTENTYDAASELESGTGASYSFDKLGERTKATPSGGPATSYAYDQAGNLTSVERPAEGEAPAISERMAYDATGLLASRTSGETTSYLTWDQTDPLGLLLDDGRRSYLYGPGGQPVEQIEGETPTYLHHDQLGSTRMLTNASGEAVGKSTYTPYGKLEASTGSATTPLDFAGQYTDPETGLQFLRARFYDPATGQFMSRDPIEAITRQPYSYALDNPPNLADPSGLLGEEVAAAAGGTCLGTVEVPFVGEVVCAGAGAVAATYGVMSLAESVSAASEGGDDESSSAEEAVPCLRPPVDPWEYETQIGDRGQTRTEEANFGDKLRSVGDSNPGAPGPGGSPKAKAVKIAALAAILYETLHHH